MLLFIDLASKQMAAQFLQEPLLFFHGHHWKAGLKLMFNTQAFSVSPIYLLLLTFLTALVMFKLQPILKKDWLAITFFTLLACVGVWGNCLDFFIRGNVADFMMIQIDNGIIQHLFIFNMADIYILVGVSMVGGLNVIRWTRFIRFARKTSPFRAGM